MVKKYLDKGNNYPTSLSLALKYFNIKKIDTPNDLLGISYIKEIIKNNYNIEPICIKRTNDYHGKDLNNDIITKNNNCFLKFCYKDDKLVGFIEYEKRDDELYISRLYSSIKRCGIGSSLINSLDGNLSLDVMINNPARVLYERLGFEYILNEDGNKIIVDNNYKMKRGKTNVKKK